MFLQQNVLVSLKFITKIPDFRRKTKDPAEHRQTSLLGAGLRRQITVDLLVATSIFVAMCGKKIHY